jgi:hypothetical protein
MTIYTFTNKDGKRFIWNTDRKITCAIIRPNEFWQVFGNKGGAVRALNSRLYEKPEECELVAVTVATEQELSEYLAQEEAHRQQLIAIGLIK